MTLKNVMQVFLVFPFSSKLPQGIQLLSWSRVTDFGGSSKAPTVNLRVLLWFCFCRVQRAAVCVLGDVLSSLSQAGGRRVRVVCQAFGIFSCVEVHGVHHHGYFRIPGFLIAKSETYHAASSYGSQLFVLQSFCGLYVRAKPSPATGCRSNRLMMVLRILSLSLVFM